LQFLDAANISTLNCDEHLRMKFSALNVDLLKLLVQVETRVFNSGRLGVNTPKNFSPYIQIL